MKFNTNVVHHTTIFYSKLNNKQDCNKITFLTVPRNLPKKNNSEIFNPIAVGKSGKQKKSTFPIF